MLRGALDGRQFDQTRTHGERPAISGWVRLVMGNLGGVNMDLMATDVLAQHAPTGGDLLHQRLPFHSRFHTNGTAGVDVFSLNVSHMPGSLQTCSGYSFHSRPWWE